MSAAAPTPLTRPNDHLWRRKAVGRAMEFLAMGAAMIGVAILVLVVYKIVRNGLPAINWNLFTLPQIPGAPPQYAQGLSNAFIGTIVIVGIAAAIGIPFGILVAIYLVEFAGTRVRTGIGLVLDILQGIPAVVVGIFFYELLVVTTHRQAGIFGSIALATMMLPLVARSTMEILLLVPSSLREASLGLGVPRWRTTLGVVLPQTIGGIVTGSILAVSRIAGEAAPLLFLSALGANTNDWNPLNPLANIPLAIFGLVFDSAYPEDIARAWAAALVLTVFILVSSLGARWLAARSKRKLGRA
jgi:phosphate transport system permease protein